MKFSTSVLSALAPVALAKSVHNHYPKNKRTEHVPAPMENGMSGWGITDASITEVVIIWFNEGAEHEAQTMNEKKVVTKTVTETVGGMPTATEQIGGATHTIVVGGAAGLVFTPDNIKADIGDMVVFDFLSANHTATQSSFDLPCEPLDGGMNSGFQPNMDDLIVPAPQVAMQVMVDTPLWFYCGQGPHCGKGMTFSINPTAEKSHAMFKAMAIEQNGDLVASPITGGDPIEAEEPVEVPAEAADELETLEPLPTGEPIPEPDVLDEPIATPAEAAEIVAGTGTILPDGSCACHVVCGVGSFPAVGAQGVGAYGGMAGALPSGMVEAI